MSAITVRLPNPIEPNRARSITEPNRASSITERSIDYVGLLVLLRDYSDSLNFYNVAELSSNRTGRNGHQVETEDEKFTVMCSRS